MKNLFKALAKFQNEVPTIHKATKGYGYSYADLPTIFGVINPLLDKHGLGVTQLLNSCDEGDEIKTIIFHIDSGETLESITRIPKATLKGMNEYQAYGSGVTYYRRYSLSCALRLVTDIDNEASSVPSKPSKPVKPTKKVLSNDRFIKALEAIKSGNTSIELLISTFNLTEEQTQELSKI
jgi:hypothetical protein